MNVLAHTYPNITHVPYPTKSSSSIGGGVLSPLQVILGIAGVVVVCAVFIFLVYLCISFWQRKMEVMSGKENSELIATLTPTQKFILAASSPTIANHYKCVIDIWDTRASEVGIDRARMLFESSWGEFTSENARNMADECMNRGFNAKYEEYLSTDPATLAATARFTDFELGLLEEVKQKYPKQGMLGWDLVRVLSIVGGAYMGGAMEYKEAAGIALKACRRLQENFSSWDDMVGSYTFGYQFWRGRKKTDRLKYYNKLKYNSWIYNISWNTELREDEV